MIACARFVPGFVADGIPEEQRIDCLVGKYNNKVVYKRESNKIIIHYSNTGRSTPNPLIWPITPAAGVPLFTRAQSCGAHPSK